MKLIKVAAATTAAIGLIACAANSQYTSEQQAAERAHEQELQAQRDARDARQAAERARLDAQIAQLEAQRAVLAQHEADARSAEKAVEAQQRTTRAEPQRSSVGVTARQLEHAPADQSKASVIFAPDRTDLSTEAKEALDGVARTVQEQTTPVHVTIRGFGDDAGMGSPDVKLSQKRAARVAEYLEGKGVSPQQITTMGVTPGQGAGKGAGTASLRHADVVVEPVKAR